MNQQNSFVSDDKQLLKRFWQSASIFWRNQPGWVVTLAVYLIGVALLQLLVQVALNLWNRHFFDALERRDAAAVWLQAEWCRYRLVPPAFVGQPPQISNSAEGTSILAAVLLSPQPTLGGASVHLPGQLELAAQKGKMPLSLLYGDADEDGARLAKSIERHLKKNTDLPYTTAVAVDKAGTLAGSALLDKHLGAPKAIWEYLESVREAKAREWLEHDFRGNAYVARDVPRVPRAMYEAIDALRQSDLAREAFGEDVVAHYLNMGEVEQRAYDMAVTDWERRRYFERG